jgi:hypothetical protein
MRGWYANVSESGMCSSERTAVICLESFKIVVVKFKLKEEFTSLKETLTALCSDTASDQPCRHITASFSIIKAISNHSWRKADVQIASVTHEKLTVLLNKVNCFVV